MEPIYDVYDKTHGHFIVALPGIHNPDHKERAAAIVVQRVNSHLEDQGVISLDEETVTVVRLYGTETILVGPSDHSFTVIL